MASELFAVEYIKLEVLIPPSTPNGTILESEAVNVQPGQVLEVYKSDKINAGGSWNGFIGLAYTVGGISNVWADLAQSTSIPQVVIEGLHRSD